MNDSSGNCPDKVYTAASAVRSGKICITFKTDLW